jgi:hypothetical protein
VMTAQSHRRKLCHLHSDVALGGNCAGDAAQAAKLFRKRRNIPRNS